MKKYLCLISVTAAMAVTSSATLVGFDGPFLPANWTQTVTNGGDGSVNTSGAPVSIMLTSSNNNSSVVPVPSIVDFFITSPISGTIQFDWSYSTADWNSIFDPFGWLRNGVFTQVTNNGTSTGSGTVSFSVMTGDQFGFRQSSTDSNYGRATTIITNFTNLTAIPEPSGTLALGCVLGGGLLIRTRRIKV